MAEAHKLFDALQTFTYAGGRGGAFYSLPQLEKAGVGPISKLPVSIRIVLESVLRNVDGIRVEESHVRDLANGKPNTGSGPARIARLGASPRTS